MKKIITYLIIAALFLIGSISSTAIESRYKNNLLNVELSQTPDNRVSVLLVFEKPYTDAIKVVYKTDNEYNILLPETYHSITSVSAINALNVRSANVKLVPYFNQDNSNGYTKITIKTTRPVIFNAHSSYITTAIAKDDLIDKLERDESLKINPTTINAQPVKKVAAKPKAKTTQKTTAKKAAPAKRSTVSKAKQKNTYKKQAQKPVNKATKPTTKPVQKATPTPPAKPQVQQKPAQQTQQATPAAPITTVSQVKPATAPPVQPEQKTSSLQSISNLINAVKTNEKTPFAILIIASLLLLALLIKVFGAAKTYIKTQAPKVQQYDEPQTSIPEEIQDLSWQEKYKYMKEHEEAQKAELAAQQEAQLKSHIDSIYNAGSETEVLNTAQAVITEQQPVPQTQEITNIDIAEHAMGAEVQDIPEPFRISDEPVNEGFETAHKEIEQPETITDFETLSTDIEELSDISDIEEPAVDKMYEQAPDLEHLEDTVELEVEINEPYITKPIEPMLINQAKISKSKGFYLIRYENEVALVGYIKEKIFFIHSFNNMEQSFVRTRLTEKQKGSEIYLVRSDDYKALVKVSKDEMKTLINL